MTNAIITLAELAGAFGVAGLLCWAIERIAQRKETARAPIVPLQPLSSYQRAIRGEDRRPVSERLAADVRQRRDPAPAFPSAFAGHSHARGERLDQNSDCYGTATSLTLGPKDGAA